MTQYYEDFSGESPIGGTVSNWTPRWVTTNTTFVSAIDADAEGGVVGSLDCTTDLRHLWSYDPVDSESPDTRDDIEVLVKYKTADVFSGSYIFGITARASGSSGAETGYNCTHYGSNANLRLLRYIAAAHTEYNIYKYGAAHFGVENNDWCFLRFRINGTTLSMKHWVEYTTVGNKQWITEPREWQFVLTDSGVSAAGWVGLFTFDKDTGPWQIAFFSVGTNGDVAPYPGGSDNQTLRITQQGINVLSTMANAETHVTQQMVQVLVQENIPAVSGAKRRSIVIGM